MNTNKHEERVESEEGNHEERLERELHDKAAEELADVCPLCEGTGEVTFGEFDDLVTKKCVCRRQDDMDDDS